VRNFICDELYLNPSDVLGQKTWQAMLEVDAVYEKEKRERDEAIANAKWKSVVIKSGVQKAQPEEP